MTIEAIRSLNSISAYTSGNPLETYLNELKIHFHVKMATVWRLNTRSNTTSVLARVGYNPPPSETHEYIHELENSLVGYVFSETLMNSINCIRIDDIQQHGIFSHHRAQERVKQLGLKRLVAIPLNNYNKPKHNEASAVLNIYTDNSGTEITDSLSSVIKDTLSSLLSTITTRDLMSMTNEILDIYARNQHSPDSQVFFNILGRQLMSNYIPCEGFSIYMWNSYKSDLRLVYTTGLVESSQKASTNIPLGFGMIGLCAERKETLIIDNIEDNEFYTERGAEPSDRQLSEFSLEKTKSPHKNSIIMPIMGSSRTKTLLGVIKLCNRVGRNAIITDSFGWEDELFLKHCCKLIAFHLESEQHERSRNAFTLQMAHEILAPATAILSTSDRYIDKWDDENALPTEKRRSYLISIRDQARLQVSLARSVEFGWKKQDFPRSVQYRTRSVNLRDIIDDAKRVVIPICRTEGIQFDNVKIVGSFPTIIIDHSALSQVFFNLLTNAVKYRDRQKSSDFLVQITCEEVSSLEIPERIFASGRNVHRNGSLYRKVSGWIITCSDYGIGIKSENSERIFDVGYREQGSERWSIRGSGIGLSVVRNILQDFGGRIWLQSCKGPTTFKIYLPRFLENADYTASRAWKAVRKVD